MTQKARKIKDYDVQRMLVKRYEVFTVLVAQYGRKELLAYVDGPIRLLTAVSFFFLFLPMLFLLLAFAKQKTIFSGTLMIPLDLLVVI